MAKLSIEFETKGVTEAIAAFHNLSKAEQSAVREVLELDKASGRAERGMKQAAETGKHGAQGLSVEFGKALAGMNLLRQAINLVQKAYENLREEQRRGGTALEQNARAQDILNQAAGGDPDKLRRLDEQRKRLQRGAGVQAGQAATTVSRAASLGFTSEEDLKAIIDLQRAEGPESDITAFLNAAAAERGAFGAGAGSLREQLIRIRSAGLSSGSSPGELARHVRTAAPQVSLIGGNAQELEAAAASIFETAGESTGSNIRAFATALTRLGITDKGLVGGVEEIEGRNLSPQQLTKLLGSVEAVSGFEQLSAQRERIRAQIATGQQDAALAGTGEDPFRAALSERTPEQIADEARRRAEEEQRLAESDAFGVQEVERRTRAAQREAVTAGDSVPVRLFADAVGAVERLFGAVGIEAAEGRGLAASAGSSLGQTRVEQLLERIAAATEREDRPVTDGGAP